MRPTAGRIGTGISKVGASGCPLVEVPGQPDIAAVHCRVLYFWRIGVVRNSPKCLISIIRGIQESSNKRYLCSVRGLERPKKSRCIDATAIIILMVISHVLLRA